MFGDNQHINIVQDNYNAHVGPGPPYVPLYWYGVDRETTAPKTLTCNCAYTFYLYAVHPEPASSRPLCFTMSMGKSKKEER